MPPWAITLALIISAIAASWLLHAAFFRLSLRLLSRREEYWRALVRQSKGPVRLTVTIIALAAAFSAAPLQRHHEVIAGHALLIGLIVAIIWVVRTALDIWVSMHLRRHRIDVADNLMARKHFTQTRILQRVADTALLVFGAGAIIMTFEGARQVGISLLASAGVAGLVVGFALQPIMRNLFAGIQLALTQPIRIDDAVIVEGEWGNVEEITSTYVVIRVWDKRRLIVPLTHFIEHPFQNWTRHDTTLIGSVMIYLDYTVPLDEVRESVAAFLDKNPLWDRDVYALQVTDFREYVMEVRILATASTAPKAFDLRCEIREHVAQLLQEKYPESLPRLRGQLDMAPGPN